MSLSTLAPHPERGRRIAAARPSATRPNHHGAAPQGFTICGQAEALLTAAQERTLAARIAAGDRDARSHLIRANLRLVVTIARGYTGRGLDPEDLVSEGYLGLITAAARFDPRFNVRFSTYASFWIKQAIRQALCNTTAMIRLPLHAIKLLSKWRRTARALERGLGREPRFEEVADAMGLPAGQRRIVAQALGTRHRCETGEMPIEVALPPGEPLAALVDAEQREELRRRLERLTPEERSVIRLRYGLGGGEPLTLKEVGRRLGFTREWARKLEVRALAKLG